MPTLKGVPDLATRYLYEGGRVGRQGPLSQ